MNASRKSGVAGTIPFNNAKWSKVAPAAERFLVHEDIFPYFGELFPCFDLREFSRNRLKMRPFSPAILAKMAQKRKIPSYFHC